MNILSKSAIVRSTGEDRSRQNGVNESRSKGKKKSLSVSENSRAAPSRPAETRIESNGHKSTTRKRIEPAAQQLSSNSGETSASAINNCASATQVAAAVVHTTAAGPPVVQDASRKDVKKMAHDCYVDLAQPLAPEIERAWDNKIHSWLDINLLHLLDDSNGISTELVMAGIEDGGSMNPTVLIMCRDLSQKESIEILLKRCSIIPENVQSRIVLFDIRTCTPGTSVTDSPTQRFLGRQIAIDFDGAGNADILYAKVARIIPAGNDGLSVFCTIGGMLSVNGKLYGLTTAHPFAALGNEGRATPLATSGFTLLGHVAYSQWPGSTQSEDVQVKPISGTYSRGEDWALVDFSPARMTYNIFHVPGSGKPQKVTGYIKTTDLRSGDVWVCAGVSGVQLGYLKQHPASIMMSGSLFGVRSLSLERPLVDGDSGSWVVRDGKLCGFIFCRTGNGVEWAYMLPIEAVLESISKDWESLHPGLPSPAVRIAYEEAEEAANKDHIILPNFNRSEPSIRDIQSSAFLKLRRTKSDQKLSPAVWRKKKFLPIIRGTSRRASSVSDNSRLSATFAETIAWDRKAVLSLDSGGVRAYSTLLIVQEIMEAIIRREKSYPDGPAESSYHPLEPPKTGTWLPCHYFDYVGGTGSGGLIAIMLGRLRMDVDDSIIAFETVLKAVFSHKRWFHSRSLLFWPRPKFDHLILEQVIRKLVRHHAPKVSDFPGSSNFAFDHNQCRTVIVAFQKGDILSRPYLFRTYNNFHSDIDHGSGTATNQRGRNFGLAHHGPIWQVARATTAAPTFFQPVTIDDIEYTSSDFGMNNPCEEIYKEVRYKNGNRRDNIILSIGCTTNSIQKWYQKGVVPPSIIQYFRDRVHLSMEETPGYYRLNVDSGMRFDEWKTRGRFRTSMGLLIGRRRSKHPDNRTTIGLAELRQDQQRCAVHAAHMGDTTNDETRFKNPQQANEENRKQEAHRDQEPQNLKIAPKDRSPIPPVGENKSNIPKWLQSKSFTKESIHRQTREYLDQEDVQSKIQDIADILVEKRRNRAGNDLERWERFCLQRSDFRFHGAKPPGSLNDLLGTIERTRSARISSSAQDPPHHHQPPAYTE